jgi:hypothetical protein
MNRRISNDECRTPKETAEEIYLHDAEKDFVGRLLKNAQIQGARNPEE